MSCEFTKIDVPLFFSARVLLCLFKQFLKTSDGNEMSTQISSRLHKVQKHIIPPKMPIHKTDYNEAAAADKC